MGDRRESFGCRGGQPVASWPQTMPRRAIFLSVLACLCLAPDAALAVTPPRDATPNIGGSQIDPSVAVTASGDRLLVATDAGASTVRVWNPTDNGGGNVTWSDTTVPGSPRQAAIAWDGGATAYVAAASSNGCGSPAPISLGAYSPTTESFPLGTTALPTFAGAGDAAQTWPRVVLGADSGHAGTPITVADEEDCASPTDEHRVVVVWGSAIRPLVEDPGVAHNSPRYPDVAVLGVDPVSGGTKLLIAYLGELSGGQQELRVRTCSVVGAFTLQDCSAADSSVAVDDFTPADPVTVGNTTVNALAAPSVACDAGTCHVVWTEKSSGRSRVFYSSSQGPNYTTWSQPTQVASSSTSSQLMPSVSAHGTRADIVYLDTRLGNSKFDAYQTSITGSVRGRDISLTNGQGYDPASTASLGSRTDTAEFSKVATTGVVRAYFPNASGDLGTVSEGELEHGTSQPALPVAGPAPSLGKNTQYDASAWLNFTDADGDPVTVTVDDPAHGSVAGGVYTPDASYAGNDTVRVRASDGTTTQAVVDHAVTITNQAPVFDPPSPAIVDEGGAAVTVPLHAADPDVNDAVVYSINWAPAPLNVAGRATIVGATLRLDVPPGARSLLPLQISLRARDTTTGAPAAYQDQEVSVTIRPDLATPITEPPAIRVFGTRATLTAPVDWNDISKGCLTSAPLGCHVRRVWSFGDASASVTTMDQGSIDHVFPRSGSYSGQVTTWILWGASQVASPPKPFTVTVHDDGRVLVAITPTIRKLSATKRQVVVAIRARATGTAWITLTYAGHKPSRRRLSLKAGSALAVRFNVSLRGLKSRRATIVISGWGMLASNVPPTNVYRSIILR
jgi:hypothetical protein